MTQDAPPQMSPRAEPASPVPEPSTPTRAGGAPGFPRGLVYAGAGALVALCVLLGSGWLLKTLENHRLVAAFEAERAEGREQRHQALHLQAGEMLRLAALPLSWAVRADLLKGNLEPVDGYFRAFVQERGVQRLLLIGKDGRIALASNRKDEGQPAEALVSPALRDAREPLLEEGEGYVRLAVPIMGLDTRLGVLIVDYVPSGD